MDEAKPAPKEQTVDLKLRINTNDARATAQNIYTKEKGSGLKSLAEYQRVQSI